MKLITILIIFACLAAVSSLNDKEYNEIKRRIKYLESRSKEARVQEEEFIFALADTYNTATLYFPSFTYKDENTKQFLAINFDDEYIENLRTKIVAKLKPLVEQIDKDWDGLLTKWSNKKVQSDLYLTGRSVECEWFFRKRIGKLIKNPAKTRGIVPLINAVLNGSGFCTIFRYPHRSESDVNANFVRLLYLFYGEDKFIRPIKNLEMECKWLRNTLKPYTEREKKAFLLSILSNQLKPIGELKKYEVGDGKDICAKLEQRGVAWIKKHLVDQQTIGIFVQECLGELTYRWSSQVNFLDSLEHEVEVIYRWFTRLEQFVQLGGDPSFKSQSADKYLKRVVDELPTPKAQLAYDTGEGICNFTKDRELRALEQTFDFIKKLETKTGFTFVPANFGDFDNFKRLSTVCSLFREKNRADDNMSTPTFLRRKAKQVMNKCLWCNA